MKKAVFILFCSLSSLGFYSCSKSDDGVEVHNIVGKWEHESFGMMINGEMQMIPDDGDCDSKRDYKEFTANGIMKSMLYNPDCESGDYAEIPYEFKDNKIFLLDEEEETVVWKVLELNNATLKLEAPLQDGLVILGFKRA